MNKVKTAMTMVVHNQNGGWDVKEAGKDKTIEHHHLKQNAVDSARQISIRNKDELVICGRDGQIQERDSHGNDPKESKG